MLNRVFNETDAPKSDPVLVDFDHECNAKRQY